MLETAVVHGAGSGGALDTVVVSLENNSARRVHAGNLRCTHLRIISGRIGALKDAVAMNRVGSTTDYA